MSEIDSTWINELADELYYGPTRHPARRHYMLMGVLLAIEAGRKAERNEPLPPPKLTPGRGEPVLKRPGGHPFTIEGTPK